MSILAARSFDTRTKIRAQSGGSMLHMPLSSRARFILVPARRPSADVPAASGPAVRRYRLAHVAATPPAEGDRFGHLKRTYD
jgi:hypothetical protein